MDNLNKALLDEIAAEKKDLIKNTILTVLTFIGLVGGVLVPFFSVDVSLKFVFFGFAFLCGGLPIAIEAVKHLINGKLDIDLLMVLAAVGAALVGDMRDGAILLFLFSLAETLEDYAIGTTKRAVVSLMKLRPEVANLKHSDGTLLVVPVEEIQIDQVVVIKPGDRIPVDGLIISGISSIDESSVTGEAMPVDKKTTDMVFAGTVNGYGSLEVNVTKTASNSTLSQMIKLVTEAQAKRSPSEQFGDWFGARYTFIVLIGSFSSFFLFLLWGFEAAEAFYKSATLLVVASPCAIVISVPAAILSALAASARRGILFKGGAALETFGKVDIIAFDKTGTLTEGKMQVKEFAAINIADEELLAVASGLEVHSEHPLAKAILDFTNAKNITAEQVSNIVAYPGEGLIGEIKGTKYWSGNRRMLTKMNINLPDTVNQILSVWEKEGKTAILFGHTEIIGLFAIADTIRADAKEAISALRKSGVKKILMLSGDNTLVAQNVGRELGFSPEDIYGDLLPVDKVTLVNNLRQTGVVAFVGDGVNDAAALATAQVGISMGSSSSGVALEVSDVALLRNNLLLLASAHSLSQKTLRIIKQNLIFAVGILSIMVIVTIFYYLPLPLGVIGHEGGTLLVVLNGLRLMYQSS